MLYRFVENHPNASLISNRSDIFWGGFNMVLAEIELMRLRAGNSGFGLFSCCRRVILCRFCNQIQ
jgi:hypothetical protein